MGWTPARLHRGGEPSARRLGAWEVPAAGPAGEHQRVAGLAGAQRRKFIEHKRGDGHRSRLAVLGRADGVIHAELHGVLMDGQSPPQEFDVTHSERYPLPRGSPCRRRIAVAVPAPIVTCVVGCRSRCVL